MKVAYVCADRGIPVFGRKGSSIHVQEILRAFLARGDEVDLFAARLGGPPPADLAALHVHEIPDPGRSHPRPKSAEARCLLDTALGSMLASADPGWSLVYERHALWSASAMAHAKARGVPGVLEVNAPLVREQRSHRRLDHPEVAAWIAGESLRTASLRVAVSRGVARAHADYGLGCEDFLVCPNGVNPARFVATGIRDVAGIEPEASPERSPDGHSFTIGFLGTLKPWHGVEVLLEAFAEIAVENAGARLLVVGDGPCREGLAGAVAGLGLASRVTFTGSVAADEVPGFLASMDVGTAPYASDENHYFSPLKIFEYMAAGRPVVASAVGQIPHLIDDGVEGRLVSPGDPCALAKAISELAENVDAARAMGNAGRSRVLASHTWDAILERVLREALPGRAEDRRECDRAHASPERGGA